MHTDYDVNTKNGILFEVKTARKGLKNDTFQFNGIDPRPTQYEYLLCLGLCEDAILFRIFKKRITFNRKKGKYFLEDDNFKQQLVKMNPDNDKSLKLTLNKNKLFSIDFLSSKLQSILGK